MSCLFHASEALLLSGNDNQDSAKRRQVHKRHCGQQCCSQYVGSILRVLDVLGLIGACRTSPPCIHQHVTITYMHHRADRPQLYQVLFLFGPILIGLDLEV